MNLAYDQLQQSSFQEQMPLIQYYIYQDFQNLVNLLYSMKAIKNYFKQQTNHPIIPISHSKIILQLNISNSIHYDLQRTYQSEQAKNLIYQERCKVKLMFQALIQDLGIEYQYFFDYYSQNSLNKEIRLNQIPSNVQQQSQGYNFNQNVLNQLLDQLEVIDKQISEMKTTKYYQVPNIEIIRSKAVNFYIMTENKLQINYPNQTQTFPRSTTNGTQSNKPSSINGLINISHPDQTSYQRDRQY